MCGVFFSSHAVTADVSLAETARAAELFMSDGIIVTGTATGEPAEPQHLTGTAAMTESPSTLEDREFIARTDVQDACSMKRMSFLATLDPPVDSLLPLNPLRLFRDIKPGDASRRQQPTL